MCGIFGTIRQNNHTPDPELVRKATRMLQHRGPDGEGYFSEGPLAFGHRRLAIIDLSDKGQQPMSAYGNVITYNGEIYNYLELRKQLQQEGYQFSSESDTEVVLAAYAHWGMDCVQHFRGMWAFAIYDRKKQSVFCSRDRFGIKPFYYTRIKGDFYFASEIKAFTVLPDWSPEWSTDYVAKFLYAGQQHPERKTIFSKVFQLPPGQQLLFKLSDNTFQLKTYYQLEDIRYQAISPEDASEQFQTLFAESIRLHLRSDVTIGTAFSGGLDSSAILASLCQSPEEKIKTIEAVAYCSPSSKLDESPYVDAFAQQYPINIHRITPDFPQLFKLLTSATVAQDEPLLSGSLLAQYAVFQNAKKNDLRVMLDGQGADELLGGYGTFYPPLFRHLLKSHPLQIFSQLLGLIQHHRIPWQRIGKPWQKTSLNKGIRLTPPNPSPTEQSYNGYTNVMLQKHLPGLLHFEDRNSMAHGVEARVPFLDHPLVAFCLSIPPELHIRKGIRKMILRDALGHWLPDKIVKRYDKIGFATPQDQWMEKVPNLVLKLAKESQLQFPEIFDKEWMLWVGIVLSKKQQRHYPLIWRAISLGIWGKEYL